MQFYFFLSSLYTFYFLIVLAQTSSNTLSRRYKRGHLCVVPNFEERNVRFFTIKCDVSCWYFVDVKRATF